MHPAALIVISPDATISRYLYGIKFPDKDLRLALLEAAEGKIGSTIDKIILSCYRYDPYEITYRLFATNIMRIGGIFTLIFIGLMLYNYWRKDHDLIGD